MCIFCTNENIDELKEYDCINFAILIMIPEIKGLKNSIL